MQLIQTTLKLPGARIVRIADVATGGGERGRKLTLQAGGANRRLRKKPSHDTKLV